MKVPKYIREALEKRAKVAIKWHKYDDIISDYITRNNIDAPSEDYLGGVEGIMNPWESMQSIIQCIEEKEEK